MVGIVFVAICIPLFVSASVPDRRHDLTFNDLAVRWDEAVP